MLAGPSGSGRVRRGPAGCRARSLVGFVWFVAACPVAINQFLKASRPKYHWKAIRGYLQQVSHLFFIHILCPVIIVHVSNSYLIQTCKIDEDETRPIYMHSLSSPNPHWLVDVWHLSRVPIHELLDAMSLLRTTYGRIIASVALMNWGYWSKNQFLKAFRPTGSLKLEITIMDICLVFV
jgi:hypothetical protein